MNKEIQEILDNLKDEVWSKTGADSYDNLLDYITDLQQENERLNQDLSYYQGFGVDMLHKNNELEERIEKAVEYIKTCNPDVDLNSMFLNESYLSNYGANELLDILNGRSDE